MTSAPPRVRPLTPDDAEQVAALWLVGTQETAQAEPIYAPGIAPAALVQLLRDELASGARRGWGAVEGDRIVAYLTCRIETEQPVFVPRRFVYIVDVDVAPDRRGRGLARLLLGEAEAFARANGIHRLELAFAAADPRAKAVWERLGFRPHFVHMHRHVPLPE